MHGEGAVMGGGAEGGRRALVCSILLRLKGNKGRRFGDLSEVRERGNWRV